MDLSGNPLGHPDCDEESPVTAIVAKVVVVVTDHHHHPLVRLLQTNPQLQTLHLSDCGLGDSIVAGLAMAVWEQSVACRLVGWSGGDEHGVGLLSLNLAHNTWSDPSILRLFHRSMVGCRAGPSDDQDDDVASVSTDRRPLLQQLWLDMEDCWQAHPEHRDWMDQIVAAMIPCLQSSQNDDNNENRPTR